MKQLFTLFIVFAFVKIGYSQEIRFGFTASPTLNFSSIEGASNLVSYNEDADSKLGFAYGILADYDFNGEDRYFLHSGVTLHHSGYNFSIPSQQDINPPIIQDLQVNVTYLEIPIALKLKTNDIGYFRYYGQFGLNNGIKVGQNIKEPENAEENEFNDFSTFNLGLNIGAGVEYNISEQTDAIAGIYFNNGLSNGLDNSAGTISQNQLGLRLGVYF